jgi:hypothetical protein
MLRGIFHGMKLAAPLLVLASASQLLAADTATTTARANQKAAATAPVQKATTTTGNVAATPANPTTTKATTNQQAVRRYHRHHRRGYGRRYVGNTQNMPSKNATAGQQINNSKNGGKVATQPVKHHNTTTQKAPKNVHKTSHKQAKASQVKKA